MGDQPLKAARTRLAIPAYDASMGRIYVFKTPHNPDRAQDADAPAVDVALATSAAPTYFPAPRAARAPGRIHRRRPVGELPDDGRNRRGRQLLWPEA